MARYIVPPPPPLLTFSPHLRVILIGWCRPSPRVRSHHSLAEKTPPPRPPPLRFSQPSVLPPFYSLLSPFPRPPSLTPHRPSPPPPLPPPLPPPPPSSPLPPPPLPVPFSQPSATCFEGLSPCFAGSRAPALAYLRTLSAANVGTDKDSEKRQRHAIQGFAKRAGFGIVEEFYDAAVSGADPIETRAGFAALLDRIEGNGVRTVIVEDASRFARELMAQELGITLLISRGVRLLTASGDDLTASDDPTRKMMRQIAGAFAEYEKARLVSKLRHARERVRQEKGKCEGRKPHGELRPEAVALAKRLHRASPKTGRRMSLRKIAAALAEAGHLNERGQPFNPKSIVAMVAQKT